MLDAVACSWGACYTSTTAKNAGVGMNSDGAIIKWDGIYWSQLSNSSNKVMKFMDLYNTDTVLVNYAVGRSGTGLWYDDGSYLLKATSIASINAPCLAKVLAHSNVSSTQRYAVLEMNKARDAFRDISNKYYSF